VVYPSITFSILTYFRGFLSNYYFKTFERWRFCQNAIQVGQPATGRHHYFYQLELEVDVDFVSENKYKGKGRLAVGVCVHVDTGKSGRRVRKQKIKPPDIRFFFFFFFFSFLVVVCCTVIITVSALGKDTTTRHSSLVSRDFSRTLVVYPNGAVPFSKLFCLCLGTVRGGEREPGLSTP
jgi:hypothetical protein